MADPTYGIDGTEEMPLPQAPSPVPEPQPVAPPVTPPPEAQPQPEAPAVPPAEENPFAARLKANPDLGHVGLGERAALNAWSAALEGGIAGSSELAEAKRIANDPTASPEARKLAQDQFDIMATRLIRYNMMPPAGTEILPLAASVAGQVAGSFTSPEAAITKIPGVGPTLRALGIAEGPGLRIGEAAISQGIVNTATDPIVQANDIAAGVQQAYDPYRTALAFPMGAATGAVFQGVHEAVNGLPAGAKPGTAEQVASDFAKAMQTERAGLAAEDPALRGAHEPAPEIKPAEPVKPAEVAVPETVQAEAPTEAPKPDPEVALRDLEAKVEVVQSAAQQAGDEAAKVQAQTDLEAAREKLRQDLNVPKPEEASVDRSRAETERFGTSREDAFNEITKSVEREIPAARLEGNEARVQDLTSRVDELTKTVRRINADESGGTSPNATIQYRRTTASPSSPQSPGAAGSASAPHEPVLSLHEQSTNLADTLGITLRQGRVGGGKTVLGKYDVPQDVARVRAIPDFETVAHEAGHALEKKVGPPLASLIQKHVAELGPMDYDPARADPREGFAEWLRQELTAPAAAQKAAPQFAQDFRTLMGREAPNDLAALDAARDVHQAYQNAPSDQKLSAIVKTQKPDTILSTLRKEGLPKSISLVLGKVYQTLFDDKAPVTMAVRDIARSIRDATGAPVKLEGADNPEILVRMFARAHQAGVRDMLDGVRPYRGIQPNGPSLRDALIKATGEPGIFGRWDDAKLETFRDYLVARRSEVLWAKYDAGDLPNPPVSLTKADVATALHDLEAGNPAFRDAGDMVHGYTRELLQKMFDGGLIDKALFSKLQAEPFYVPMYRVMDDKPLAAGASTASNRSEGPGKTEVVKRMRGSGRDVIDPLQSLMTQTFLVNRTLAHNDIIKSFVNLARLGQKVGATGIGRVIEEIPATDVLGKRIDLMQAAEAAAKQNGLSPQDTQVLMGGITHVFGGQDPIIGTIFHREPTKPNGEPIVFYKDGGQLRAVRMISKDEGIGLYDTLTTLPEEMRDVALKTMAAAAATQRIGITTNWVFAFTNWLRDQQAAFLLRPDYLPFDPRGLVSEVRQDNIAQLYNYAGGVSPGAGSAGLHDFIDRDIEALARKGWLVQKVGGIGDLFHEGKVLPALKAVAETVETAETGTRLNVMRQVYGQKLKQGLSPYDAMMEAAYQATDLMDFGRHGSGTLYLRTILPFVNAHLQSLDLARRTMVTPLYRAMRGDVVTEAEQAAVKNAGIALGKVIGVGSALGFAYSMWANQHQAYNDANAQLRATHLVVPGDAFGMPGKILVIPKPFELAIGFNIGEQMAKSVVFGDPRAKDFALQGLQEVLMPPNFLEDIPLLKAWAELKLNRSFFTGRNIVSDALSRLTPGEQYTSKTSQLAKTVGSALGISPIKVDYAVGSAFGLWGRDLMAASNFTNPDAPAPSLYDQMFFRRFIKDADAASETTKSFWNFASQQSGSLVQAKATFDRMVDEHRDDDAQRFLGALPATERAYVTLASGENPDTGKPAFNADDRKLHPLNRAANATAALSGVIKQLQSNQQSDFATGERIDINPQDRRSLIENLRILQAMEEANALKIAGQPGFADRPLLSTDDQFGTIMAISPAIGERVAAEYAHAKVAPTETIARVWPEMQARLLSDGSQAQVRDLTYDAKADGYAFGGERVKKAPKRRIEVPGTVQQQAPIQAPAAVQ